MFNYPSFKAYKDICGTFISILFAITSYGQAHDIIWAKTYGGSSGDIPWWMQRVTDGEYIISAATRSGDGDVTGFHGGFDAWVISLKDSNIVWEEALGGTGDDYAFSVAVTKDSGYIIAGTTASNDGDVSGNHGKSDMWVVKLSAGGSIQWQKCLGGSDDDYAASIQQTTDGGYIVAGQTLSNDGDVSGNHGREDMWIVKLNDTGKIQWQKCLGGGYNENALSIAQTKDGGYIVAGTTNSDNADVSGYHGAPYGYYDFWVVKLDDTGKIQWQRCLGGDDDDEAAYVAQTKDGGYIVTGQSRSVDGDVTGNHGLSDVWVVKLTDTGSITWQRSYGGSSYDYANSVLQTNDNGYLICATTNSNDGNVRGNHGSYDYWLIKISATDSLEWQKCLGGSNYDVGVNVIQNSDSSYIVAGQTISSDGEVKGYRDTNYINSGVSGDVWVVKLGDTIRDTITNVSNINKHDIIKVYPTIVS
ncbi:MAG TPA: hypothetical protein VN721_09385, partial [Flavipsychrobacter sp.]|nr:hypothetical protein [Flavipsychrobacter sp.]